MNLDIISVGSAGFDIFISGKDIRPSQFASDGTLELQDNNSYDIEHSVYEAGGTGLNAAITFARQGIKTGCIARTGKDHLANQIKIIAKHEELESELLVSNPEHHTDMNIHMVTERSHEIKLDYQNSANSLKASDIRFPELSARLVYLAELPTDLRLYKFFENWAKIKGAQLALNLSSSKGYKRSHLNFVLSSVDRIMMPMYFASELFGGVSDPAELTRQLIALGTKSVLLYDVNKEAYAYEDSTLYSCGQYKNINALDFTGAEDVFSASYTASVFQQKSVAEALTFASANACSVLEVFGARAGILKKPALRTIKVQTGGL